MQSYKDKQETLLKTMKLTGLALAASTLMAVPTAFADNTASAFYDGAGGFIGAAALTNGGDCDADGYCKVLSTVLANSGTPKDLIIGLSFETMLMTETSVKGQKGSKSTSIADAAIRMKVYVDGKLAAPGAVTFDRRYQELWAVLGGVLESCEDGVLDGVIDGIISADECTFTDEEIGLILDTTQASTFNFLSYNIGSGSHTIEAYALLEENGEVVGYGGNSAASALLGKGTLSAWEVHGAVNK
ncbi:hypothetical protein [Marinobacterium rhizophilum]|uniref:Uncharacterized protein n=1 Tax=Marinobacterium rhizophilum TaxID=420402 RepID=A0ABY5HGT6_9GAMM|nr:hypothetical protein [Marinobacterium rhizophilum]UTW11581.1 hypothetical protein KDW95_20400 [Marinobacterium rhizophilum]